MYYYTFNIGDYRHDTQHLTLLEHGIYRLLLDQYYLTEKPIDANALRLLCIRNTNEVAIAFQILEEFFNECEQGKFEHKRARLEIEKFHEKSEKASKSAKLRWDANALPTQCEGNANHKPLTKNHKPIKPLTTPDGVVSPNSVTNQKPLKNKTTALIKTTVGETELQAACRETWGAYCVAYAARYKADPVRNAMVNAQVKQFVQRIGARDSPLVAAFYVTNCAAFYVKKMHSVGMLLADAEKLRTEWATNTRVTDTEARMSDETQQRGSVWTKLIEEAREREQNEA